MEPNAVAAIASPDMVNVLKSCPWLVAIVCIVYFNYKTRIAELKNKDKE